ncbi:MAG: hypothetical protein GF401_19055 [Chitinivibrionales bacterium]|nr:hypothetical protein [Chitinivibrionales bacterium]
MRAQRVNIAQCLVSFLFIIVMAAAAQSSFKIENLDKLPSYERYEMVEKGSSSGNVPVVIEYRVKNRGKSNACWKVNGTIQLPGMLIEEEYEIVHDQLKIREFKRKQTTRRGTVDAKTKIDMDVYTSDPDEFIITAIPGIMYILRTFPFHSGKKMVRVRIPQQNKKISNFKVVNKGKKRLATKHYGTIEVYQLEVSIMMPVVGMIAPKLNFYFLNDPQKTLVAIEGTTLASGKDLNVELKSYTLK